MEKPNPLDFFAGGVPASAIFQMAVLDIRKLTQHKPPDEAFRALPELCFIGLVSYFEAFCRDCFSSIINIAPSLLRLLKEKSYEVRIDPLTALEMQKGLSFRLGFLVAEGLDFGTAKKVNSLYFTLLGITPFSRKEQTEHDKVLFDRNLLVHHGGIYTQSYLAERFSPSSGLSRVFMDSLRVDISYLDQRINFLLKIAKKMVKGSKAVLAARIRSKELHLSALAKRAFKLFDYWDEEQIMDG